MRLKNGILKRLQIITLHRKILFAQLVFAVIPLIAITSMLLYIFNQNRVRNYHENMTSRLSIISQSIENHSSLYLSRSYLIVNNNYTQSILRDVIRGEYEGILDMQNLISSLTMDLIPQHLRTAYFTFYVDGYQFGDSIYVESIQNFPDRALQNEILGLQSNQVLWGESIYSNNPDQSFMVFYRNVSPLSRDAILRVYIPYREIENLLNQFSSDGSDFIVIHRSRSGAPIYFKDNSHVYKNYDEFEPESHILIDSDPLPDGSIVTI